jgi:2'-5' RNA ligase
MNRLWSEPTARVFIACDLPRPVDEAVRKWQSAALSERPELRLAGSLHITLCFLGEVARERGAELVAALASIAVPAVPVTLGDVVFLPGHGRRRAIAVLVDDPSHELRRVQADVSEALAGTGLDKPEKRAYLPHLTVARFRRSSHPFALQNVNVGQFCLSELILYTSVLERGGAVHTPLAVFPAK